MIDVNKCACIHGNSRVEIEKKIDEFLAEEKPFNDVRLILSADGHSIRYRYKGVTIREWHQGRNVRFDSAVELLD